MRKLEEDFDMDGALEKLGGKYWNFDEGDGEFS